MFVEKLRVYFITDIRYGKHEELAEKALKGGVRAIQLREKNMSGRDLYFTAKNLRKITLDYDALLFINDRVDVAIAVEADGVHVGQKDLPAHAIREFFDGYIGVSAHTAEEAKKAERYADYLGVGPVFKTETKKNAREPMGIESLKMIVDSVRAPVVAIGGINPKNAEEVLKAGAAGIAVVSAIASAEDVEEAARNLVTLAKASPQNFSEF